MTTADITPISNGNYINVNISPSGAVYQAIDDPPGTPDDATTYIFQRGPGLFDKASVILSPFSATLGAISQVVVSSRNYNNSVSALTFLHFLRVGGTDYVKTAQSVPGLTWTDFTDTWTSNPATGADWELSDLVALEAGIQPVSGYPFLCTQLYATVTYSGPPNYVINSTTFYGVKASWQRVVKRKNSDGSIVYQPYALHAWEISQAEMASFLALNLVQGRPLTSLQTVSLADNRLGATYTNAELVEITNISQTGLRATGLRVVFRVSV